MIKICLNCKKKFIADGNARYCDECKNGKIYMQGHEKEQYGELIVDAVYRHKDKQYAECTCSCGKKCEIRYDSLKGGKTVSCGHVKEKYLTQPVDLTNVVNKNGVKALYHVGKVKGKNVWHCVCTCGKEFDTTVTSFKRIKSCGHLQDEARMNNIRAAQKEFGKYSVNNTNAIRITSKISKNNTSGFKGVSWDNAKKKWMAQIVFQGKHYHLGRYDTIEKAVEIRMIAEKHTFNDFLKWFSKEYPTLYKERISDRTDTTI